MGLCIISSVVTKLERAALQTIGKRGGKARAKKLTATRRQDIARAAANARWAKDRKTA